MAAEWNEDSGFAGSIRDIAKDEIMKQLNSLFFSASIIAQENNMNYALALKQAHAELIERYLKEE